MGARFDGSTADHLDVGSATELDDKFAGTMLGWHYWDDNPTAYEQLFYKGANFLYAGNDFSGAHYELSIARASTNLTIIAYWSALPNHGTGKWVFMACTFNSGGADSVQKLYSGDLSNLPQEATAYIFQQAGSGTETSNASSAAMIGGDNVNDAFDGNYGEFKFFDVVLTLTEIEAEYHKMRTNIQHDNCMGWWKPGFAGDVSGTQPDLSYNLNNGTPSGLVVDNNVPLGFLGFATQTIPTAATINAALTDGFKGGDSAAKIATYAAAVADGLKSGDSNINIAQLLASLNDGVDLGDSAIRTLTTAAIITDGAKFSDSDVGLITLLATSIDGIKLGDTALPVAQMIASLTDGVKFSDSVLRVLTMLASTSDGAKFGDTPTAVLSGIIAAAAIDGAKFGDTPVSIAVLLAIIADGASLSDTPLLNGTFNLSLSDGSKFGDSVLPGFNFPVASIDGMKLGDTTVGVILTLITALIADGVKFSDSALTTATLIASSIDGVKFADTVAKALTILTAATDGLKLSDVTVSALLGINGEVTITFSSKAASITFTSQSSSITFNTRSN